MSNTYLSITYTTTPREGEPRWEAQFSSIRPSSRPTPTDRGAARIVAKGLWESGGIEVKPSDISIERIEEMVYAS